MSQCPSKYGNKGKGIPLTAEEKTYIKRRWKEDAFIGQIAKEIGRNQTTVRTIIIGCKTEASA